jgi:hypothetical protein
MAARLFIDAPDEGRRADLLSTGAPAGWKLTGYCRAGANRRTGYTEALAPIGRTHR